MVNETLGSTRLGEQHSDGSRSRFSYAPEIVDIINLQLAGPLGAQQELGETTAIPQGTELVGASVEDGTATLLLSQEFVEGESSDTNWAKELRMAQIVFQATQVVGVDLVEVQIEGIMQTDGEDVSEEVAPITPALGRDDFGDLAPPIVVNEPRIATEHESPIVMTGTANVFEATVSYELTLDEKGHEVLFESFTTATCGSGCRGEFSDEIPFEVDEPTDATLRVFEVSAEDGSRLHEVILPIRLLPSD